ncbi:hypothetical protein M8998_07010 [Sphingobacterium sp. lm-10]|uniref:hypothetical protein n=1 Tax=Sphingobacterium sp. lm-10 TaxID=2944904 RepID=UPI0020218FA1|nr:hypothetical protein [Sphingobacterium sp. lm-10]MCL7987683.1 hypothetical protein [Sphingobacterium sp. lm-10]
MRKIIFITTILLLSIIKVQAQSGQVTTRGDIIGSSHVTNGQIRYTDPSTITQITGMVTFGKDIGVSVNPMVQAIFVLRRPNGAEVLVSDSIRVAANEFSSQLSTPKAYTIRLQPNNKDGRLFLRYRYYGLDGAKWSANQSAGGWEVVYQAPQATISGPDVICSNAIFEVANANSVTLGGTPGIATITKLSETTYRVQRTGSQSGTLTIHAQNTNAANTSVYKNILIGSQITGVQWENVNGAGSFTFSLIADGQVGAPLSAIQSVDWTVTNSNTSSIFTTKEKQYAVLNVTSWDPYVNKMITVTAVVTTTCGQTYTFTKQFGAGPGGDLEDS